MCWANREQAVSAKQQYNRALAWKSRLGVTIQPDFANVTEQQDFSDKSSEILRENSI